MEGAIAIARQDNFVLSLVVRVPPFPLHWGFFARVSYFAAPFAARSWHVSRRGHRNVIFFPLHQCAWVRYTDQKKMVTTENCCSVGNT
jgi:hypothetical protein